jgi:predicted PurR-regulated permease PerM
LVQSLRLLIIVLFGTLGGLGALSPPAASWAQKLPTGIPKLQERLSFLSRPIAAFQKFANQAQGLTQGDEPKAVPVAVQGSGLSDRLLSGTCSFASGLLETVLVLFFLLVSGDMFLRRLVEIMPRFRDKRQAVDISKQIESDVSAYLFTVTIMNLAVGVASGTVMALCGVGDPVLWGTVAFLLNYIPILGPMTGILVFLLAGLLSINSPWGAFLPAGLYLLIHLVEGETVTPMLLAAHYHQSGAGHPLAGVIDPFRSPAETRFYGVCLRASRSISTSAPRARAVTPMQVRAGSLAGAKYDLYTAFIAA